MRLILIFLAQFFDSNFRKITFTHFDKIYSASHQNLKHTHPRKKPPLFINFIYTIYYIFMCQIHTKRCQIHTFWYGFDTFCDMKKYDFDTFCDFEKSIKFILFYYLNKKCQIYTFFIVTIKSVKSIPFLLSS